MKDFKREITYEYIRGLTEGRGCFTFCSVGFPGKNKVHIPTFTLSMSSEDMDLVTMVVKKLGIKNKIYEYGPRKRSDGINRKEGKVILMVRDVGQIKNKIVPLFYKKLAGSKGRQFSEWLEKIGNDKDIPESYRFINKIYKAGFYDRNQRFID